VTSVLTHFTNSIIDNAAFKTMALPSKLPSPFNKIGI
jgi:hypothetical protein